MYHSILKYRTSLSVIAVSWKLFHTEFFSVYADTILGFNRLFRVEMRSWKVDTFAVAIIAFVSSTPDWRRLLFLLHKCCFVGKRCCLISGLVYQISELLLPIF